MDVMLYACITGGTIVLLPIGSYSGVSRAMEVVQATTPHYELETFCQ